MQIFCIIVENIEQYYGGEFGNNQAVMKYVMDHEGLSYEDDYEQLNKNNNKKYCKMARDQHLAITFLLGSTGSKYA